MVAFDDITLTKQNISMNISTINKTMLSFALVVFSLGFITQSQAQYTLYGDNVVINGDFSAADSAWEPNGGNGTATFDGGNIDIVVTTAGNMWDFQVYQVLSADQIAALAEGGDWELTFDAASPDGAKTFHVFLVAEILSRCTAAARMARSALNI